MSQIFSNISGKIYPVFVCPKAGQAFHFFYGKEMKQRNQG
jgi:hypothetical protein